MTMMNGKEKPEQHNEMTHDMKEKLEQHTRGKLHPTTNHHCTQHNRMT
jgi:hypothetical protein